jgi:hypothetical protein
VHSFWASASNAVPGPWAAAGAAAGIVTLNQTAAQTQADLALMFAWQTPSAIPKIACLGERLSSIPPRACAAAEHRGST